MSKTLFTTKTQGTESLNTVAEKDQVWEQTVHRTSEKPEEEVFQYKECSPQVTTDLEDKRENKPIIINDHMHTKLTFWVEKSFKNIPQVLGN